MLILHAKKYKCVFVVFSRCWSKTIISWINKLNNIQPTITRHNLVKKDSRLSFNSTKQISSNDTVYIMIRNPYERILSHVIAHYVHKEVSFLTYVRRSHDLNYLLLSQPIVLDIMDTKRCELLYFENFKQDLMNICKKHNINIPFEGIKEFTKIDYVPDKYRNRNLYDIKLKHFHHDRILPHYKFFYNQEIINKIHGILKNDFKLFNFEKNIGTLSPV